ncbi:MAG TPA: UdgX family uracil-DNA binding protein [Candidatus Tumulicola sp.]|nr:UdgX family uracil-DNA binding protein [Candidatus Tumulicola sp.]
MKAYEPSALDFLPAKSGIRSLRSAAAHCQACDLYRHATQTVFGQGRLHAALMLVGEQPGDSEDLAGRPFVGPAGKLLRRATERAGIDAADIYVTNAVKHFKFVMRGKRRIHATPKVTELRACRPWLEAEVAAVKPRVVVALGASAARSLLGASFRLTQHRGELFDAPPFGRVAATLHPSAILRMRGSEERTREFERLADDLRVFARTAGLAVLG